MSSDAIAPKTLAEWRTANGLSQSDLAARLSATLGRTVHQQSVHHWESGVMPGADVAEAVRKLTDGAVTGGSYGRREWVAPTEQRKGNRSETDMSDEQARGRPE